MSDCQMHCLTFTGCLSNSYLSKSFGTICEKNNRYKRNFKVGKQLSCRIKASLGEEFDKVALPTPFGIVFRDLNQLPENILDIASAADKSETRRDFFTEEKFEELTGIIRTKGGGTVVVPNVSNTPLNPSDFKRRVESFKSFANNTPLPKNSPDDFADMVNSLGFQVLKDEPRVSSPSTREKLRILQELTFYPPSIRNSFFLECTRSDGPCERDELLRSQAIYSLAIFIKQESCNNCVDAILYALNSDPDPSVRASAASALGFIGDKANVQALIHSTLEDSDWLVKMTCINSLGALRDDRAAPALLSLLKKFPPNLPSQDSFIIQSLIGALAELQVPDAVPYLIPFKDSPDEMIRFQLSESLRFFGNEEGAMEALQSLIQDESSRVSRQAFISLSIIQDIS
ncbi:hypothetical protein GAYE_FCTG49G0077 [Galdieria yellowstonensis]|uniref:Uncharacterized protein n=1 Tax=Galdieria yellowstonensis TaxID=3028027 RepID=A0AAV9I272_9RHOD|nr:hypothetical protein GAYE_FCTG49G0077 [Galdieria yellowstonensis]